MRVVKALVLVMGLLIVIGIALVVYGLSRDKASETIQGAPMSDASVPSVPVGGDQTTPRLATNPTAQNVQPVAPLGAFGDIEIDMTPDEELIGYSYYGDQIVLHIANRDNSTARLVILSLRDKKVLGRVLLGQTAN
ncbi:hypothetical protein LPB41_13260 [Thalassospira sp. MA62]|nr:hypothetical protein [Thalassospira sp. MA62]